jgi:hypothetical protein
MSAIAAALCAIKSHVSRQSVVSDRHVVDVGDAAAAAIHNVSKQQHSATVYATAPAAAHG